MTDTAETGEWYRKVHKAQCSACGRVEKETDSGTFIDAFFLPDICAGCGESMPSFTPRDEKHPHWRHVIEKQRFVPPVRTMNPLTWFRLGRWEVVDTYSWRA